MADSSHTLRESDDEFFDASSRRESANSAAVSNWKIFNRDTGLWELNMEVVNNIIEPCLTTPETRAAFQKPTLRNPSLTSENVITSARSLTSRVSNIAAVIIASRGDVYREDASYIQLIESLMPLLTDI
jgi:hypothetical protein